jgi:hypothetical protein
MPDQPQAERFKAEMPQIPGVSDSGVRPQAPSVKPALRMVAALLVVLVIGILAIRWLMPAKRTATLAPPPAEEIQVPPAAVDPTADEPRATAATPEIATVAEMAKPWSSKNFFFVNHFSNESTPALLIRLPSGSASKPQGYWALAMKAPYGNCQLEYIQDVNKLRDQYDFQGARHPMVGDPCSRTLFDPTKMAEMPGNIWVQGSIAQGSDLRPPLGIEVQIRGKNILAVRME